MHRSLTLLFLLLMFVLPAAGQIQPVTGLRDNTPAVHALTNARVVIAPGRMIQRGTLVIRNGIIEAVGDRVAIPADARVWDMEGKTLYPGFIDVYSDYGLPKPPPPDTPGPQRQEQPSGADHWNVKSKSEFDVAAEFRADAKTAEKLRSQGFTLVNVVPRDGIFRGQAALIHLGSGPGSSVVIKRRTASAVSFHVEGNFFSGYPNSLMGILAFIRQTWIDVDWYRRAWESFHRNPAQQRPETNNDLAALLDAVQGRQPVFMDANDDLSFLRAVRIGKEFSLNLIVRGSGEEYRRLDAVRNSKTPVVVPLNFPETPEVETPEGALNVTLDDLQHWDAAPENAGRLVKANIPIALTADQLKDTGTFLAQMRKAVDRGLSSDAALAALTMNPAAWLGVANQAGSLERGKTANILIADGDIFEEKTHVREVWIDGTRYEVKTSPTAEARGTWEFTLSVHPGATGILKLKGDENKPTGTITWAGKDLKIESVSYTAGRISFKLPTDSIGWKGVMTMSGTVTDKEIFGYGNRIDGVQFTWDAVRKEPAKVEADTSKQKQPIMASFETTSPPGEYGRTKQPDQPQHVLIRNGTVWTQGKQGKLLNTDVLITRGKISQIGKNLQVPSGAVVVDGTNKHVTPGMIDAHSHTAAASINEGGQAITPETRIEDVINSDDIWIYRQLAGGTTAANILHGSANPIGGQNSVVKWRWGLLPDGLLFEGAPPGVKFALGENVKRSNFNPPTGTPTRYPATRMGVEQIIRDRFKAAQDYEKSWKIWEQGKAKIPPRRDLELEAIVQMLHGTRLIHSHCYRQDEILMLLRVAEDFGIKIATLQHVLEGYKVAEAIAKHGAGASSFSDWWAYKMEAWDAIPGNGPLMHKQGVLVSYNSDNSQLATRLNWEAAKALEFGISEEEALSFVTLNPAKQLRIDSRVGSIETGKDADIAIWNGSPLSTLTKCEQTWVDGRKYFDLKEDEEARKEIQRQRAVLVQKVLADKKESGGSDGPGRGPRKSNETELQSCINEVVYEN
ncbi:MAG: amidohydrolase family protein [Bacteroidota bacterium]